MYKAVFHVSINKSSQKLKEIKEAQKINNKTKSFNNDFDGVCSFYSCFTVPDNRIVIYSETKSVLELLKMKKHLKKYLEYLGLEYNRIFKVKPTMSKDGYLLNAKDYGFID